MNDDELKKLIDEVAAASGYGGLDMGTMYGKFAFDVAKRAVLAERQACAKVCEQLHCDGVETYLPTSPIITANGKDCAEAIRERSNAAMTGPAGVQVHEPVLPKQTT